MEQSERTGRRAKRKFMVGVLVLLLIVAAGTSTLLFVKYQDALKDNPQREQQRVLTALAEVIQLPKEAPGFSTVVDVSKLSNPTLKARAKNGDKLIVFAKAKRLVIYRPSTTKVIDMLTIQDKQPVAGVSTNDPASAD